tara:strand:+ start:6730 stop:7089 length:360 start_codon:yes stop_codon:yes gene_type:complete
MKDHSKFFNESKLIRILKKHALSLGSKLIYQILVLLHLLKSDKTPRKTKLAIVAALGYFVFPLDAIPDFLPGGWIDDGIVIVKLLKSIQSAVTPEIEQEAQGSYQKIFKKPYGDKNIKE